MAALSEILIPGERVVARYLPMGLIWGTLAFIGALPVLAVAMMWNRTDFVNGEQGWFLYIVGGITLYLLLSTYYIGRWNLAVADRRVIHRPPGFPPRAMRMNLDEIEDVRRDIVFRAVLLRGTGRELAIRLGAAETARLLEALNRPSWDELPLAGKGRA